MALLQGNAGNDSIAFGELRALSPPQLSLVVRVTM